MHYLIGTVLAMISGWMFKEYALTHIPGALGLGVFFSLSCIGVYLSEIISRLDKNRP
jgi:uncharacterized membrane protein YhdT